MPIPKKHQQLFLALRMDLISDISLQDGFFAALRSHHLITAMQERRFKNTHHAEYTRVEDLLCDLEKRDETMLLNFIKCLKKTGQDSVAKMMEGKAMQLGIPAHEYRGKDDLQEAPEPVREDTAWKDLLQKYYLLWLKNLDIGQLQPHMYQAQILTHTDMDVLDDCPAHEKSKMFLKILPKKSKSDFDKFIQILKELDHEDLVPDEMGGNTKDTTWKDLLQKYHILWLENIDVVEFQPHMYQEGIFDDKDIAELHECPGLEKTRLFLRILGRKSRNAFKKFIQVLRHLDKDYLIPDEMKHVK